MEILERLEEFLLNYMDAQTAGIVALIVLIGAVLGILLGVIKIFSRLVMIAAGLILIGIAFGNFQAEETNWVIMLSCFGGGIACILAVFRK